MSRNYSSSSPLKRRRRITLAWVAGLAILIVGLMVYQQTEVLYVLSTLSVTALLIVVAIADLKGPASSEQNATKDTPSTSVNTRLAR